MMLLRFAATFTGITANASAASRPAAAPKVRFLKGAGNRYGSGQVDAVSAHYYAGSSWADSISIPQTWASRMWSYIQGAIAANDTRPLPVYITEWNLGTSDNGTGFNPTLGHGLVVADMLGAFAQSGVAQTEPRRSSSGASRPPQPRRPQ